MKTLGKIILWAMIIIILIIVIAFLLPRSYRVERSIVIGAERSTIYQLTCNLKKWDLWTPWTRDIDTTAIFELSGNDCEPGTIWRWDGEMFGEGEILITEVVQGELFTYDLMFDKGKVVSKGSMKYTQENDSVRVVWTDEGDLGWNPVTRYMGLFMAKAMRSDFDKGLARLKEVAEERNSWPPIEEKEMAAQLVLLIRDSAGPESYAQVMGKGYTELQVFVQKNKLTCTGHPFAIYHSWDSLTMRSVFDLGMSIKESCAVSGRIRLEEIPAQQVVVADYFGPYDQTYQVYNALDKYIAQSHLKQSGGPWEIYITDPLQEPDTAKWQTQILFPVE